MRLLLLNHNYRAEGTYYRAMPMAVQLARRGHEVTLLTVSSQHPLQAAWSMVDGVRLVETPNWGQTWSGEGYGVADLLWRSAHALARRYDIAHMFDHKPNATFPAWAARLFGARLVADWADWWGGPGGVNDVRHRRFAPVAHFEAWWEVTSKLHADGVVTISMALRQRALDLGCRPERVLYLPTGAAAERIQPLPLALARQRLGLPSDRRVLGFIGMGQGELDVVMAALCRLPDVWLMVIGKPNAAVLSLARQYGVEERLWQTGFVADGEVGAYLSVADVMVLPMVDRAANRGRLPNKLLDYLAAGRPVVASPVGDVCRVIQEHRVGLVANDDSFAAAAKRLLEDEPLRRELGANARRVAETVFAWPSLIDRLERFYAQIISG